MGEAVGRPYSFDINIGSTTAQIDIFELVVGTNKPMKIIGFEIGQTSEVGDAQEEQLVLLLKRVTGAPTSGSGGTADTAGVPMFPNDTAEAATFETGNTTKLTGGTSSIIKRLVWNVRQPALYAPLPEMRPIIDQGTRLVLELATTPADAISAIMGTLDVVEMI